MSLRPARRMQGIERTLIRTIFDAARPDAINLGLGQPDLGTPAEICLAGIAGIARGRTGYTTTAGTPELRQAVVDTYPWLGGDPDAVVVTVGSQEALFAACLTLVDPGDEILFPDPGYPAYPVVARLIGATPVSYPLSAARGFRLQAGDVLDRVGQATRLVLLSAPSNPTGRCHPEEELRELITELDRRGVPWISDEIYAGFHYGEPPLAPGSLNPVGGLTISGLSKDASMTGWRVGWVAGPPEIVRRIVATHQFLVTCSSSVSQAAAVAAFGPEGRVARRRMLDRFRARRELMGQELTRIRGIAFDPPEGAFYYFVDVSGFGDDLELCRRILDRRNVVTIPGRAFGEHGAGYLRISFAAEEEAIREGIARIAAELSG